MTGTPSDRLNEYLDSDDPESVDLTGIPNEEIARQLFVVGVTRHLLTDAGDETERNVRDGIARVAEIEAHQRRVRSRTRWLGGLAAAAAVIITAVVYLWEPPGFKPLLARIHSFVIAEDVDREFKISFMESEVFPEGVSLGLFLRGTDRYASLIEFDFFGQKLENWLGSNGRDYWLVPPDISHFNLGFELPVFVSEESLGSRWKSGQLGMYERFAQRIVRIESSLMIFNLLSDLQRQYKVEETPANAERIPLQEGQVDLTAYRNPQEDITIPDSIRMIVDADTGVLRSIILRFVELPGGAGFLNPHKGVRYDLVRESLDWSDVYEHDMHHDPDREVVIVR